MRYRPSEALNWLKGGFEENLKYASRLGKAAIREDKSGDTKLRTRVKSAGKALLSLGLGAYREIASVRSNTYEFVVSDENFSAILPNRSVSVQYSSVQRITATDDGFLVHFGQSSLLIKPYAYVVAGLARAPIGWERDGHEVPFETLVEELSARSGIEIE